MATKLIRLDDSTLVEVEASPDDIQQIGFNANKVTETFDKIKPTLISISKPIVAAWAELNKDMNIDQAEVELGLSFEGEGNLYVTKSKAGANLVVKLVLKPKDKS